MREYLKKRVAAFFDATAMLISVTYELQVKRKDETMEIVFDPASKQLEP